MANNRDSSKQKRARQNRAQRDALQARTTAASEPVETRKAKYASSGPSQSGSGRPTKKERPERPERPPRPGDVPVDIEALEGNWYSKRMTVPGGRFVMMGALLTLILTVLTLLSPIPIRKEDQVKGGPTTQSIFDILHAVTIPVVLIPLIASLVASWFILSPHRRRIWIGCAVVATIGVSLLGFQYIFPVGFLVYGVMRSNKIEGPSPRSRAGRAAAAAAAADDSSEPDEAL